MSDLNNQKEHDNKMQNHHNVKRRLSIKRTKKPFALNQKYYFVSLLTDFTKFVVDSVECIGYINTQISTIDTLLDRYKIIKTSAKYAKDDELSVHIKNLQSSIRELESGLNYKHKRLFYLIATSKKLQSDIVEFAYATENDKIRESLKDTFHKVITDKLNNTTKATTTFNNSNVEQATSLIESSAFSINNLKNSNIINKKQQLDNLYKEIVDIKISLNQKKEQLDSAITTQLNNFKELFVTNNDSPQLIESVLDTAIILKRKEIMKRLLKAV
jgi:hypothetical protein